MVLSISCGLTPRPTDSEPCGSKSTSSTLRPYSASAAPRLMVVVVLPTPPFWLHIAMIRPGPWVSRGGGSGNSGIGRPVDPSAGCSRRRTPAGRTVPRRRWPPSARRCASSGCAPGWAAARPVARQGAASPRQALAVRTPGTAGCSRTVSVLLSTRRPIASPTLQRTVGSLRDRIEPPRRTPSHLRDWPRSRPRGTPGVAQQACRMLRDGSPAKRGQLAGVSGRGGARSRRPRAACRR